LDDLISKEQSGFVAGRMPIDGIITAQETIQLKKSSQKPS